MEIENEKRLWDGENSFKGSRMHQRQRIPQNNYIQPSRSISGSGSSSDDDSCPNRSVTLRDLYSLRQVLSDTSNGTVFSGRRRRDGRPVAIKRIMRNKVKRWGIVRDRQVVCRLLQQKRFARGTFIGQITYHYQQQ